jgi:hypothetical protein
MNGRKTHWRVIYISGYVLLGFAALLIVWDYSTRENRHVVDFGLVVAYGAIIFIGLLATVIGESFKKLEERLDRIEGRGRSDPPGQ